MNGLQLCFSTRLHLVVKNVKYELWAHLHPEVRTDAAETGQRSGTSYSTPWRSFCHLQADKRFCQLRRIIVWKEESDLWKCRWGDQSLHLTSGLKSAESPPPTKLGPTFPRSKTILWTEMDPIQTVWFSNGRRMSRYPDMGYITVAGWGGGATGLCVFNIRLMGAGGEGQRSAGPGLSRSLRLCFRPDSGGCPVFIFWHFISCKTDQS